MALPRLLIGRFWNVLKSTEMPPISILPALVVFVLILLRQLGLDDYFYQLKAGEYFFKTGKVLAENYFSFTAPHFEWINHAWGSGVLFYGIYSTLGHYGALCVGAACFWRWPTSTIEV